MKTYKVTSTTFDGCYYAQYSKGILTMLMGEGVDKTEGHRLALSGFPLQEGVLLTDEMLHAIELRPKSVADKVALFCLQFRAHKGFAYRAGKEEKANMKLVTVNEKLLNTYFAGLNYPLSQTKTMADYVRHYNTVRDLAANGKVVKSTLPDVYDREYEKRLGDDVPKLQRYWAHLRELGWKRTNEMGWVSPEQLKSL